MMHPTVQHGNGKLQCVQPSDTSATEAISDNSYETLEIKLCLVN